MQTWLEEGCSPRGGRGWALLLRLSLSKWPLVFLTHSTWCQIFRISFWVPRTATRYFIFAWFATPVAIDLLFATLVATDLLFACCLPAADHLSFASCLFCPWFWPISGSVLAYITLVVLLLDSRTRMQSLSAEERSPSCFPNIWQFPPESDTWHHTQAFETDFLHIKPRNSGSDHCMRFTLSEQDILNRLCHAIIRLGMAG